MSAQSQIFNPTLRTSQASGDGFSCPVMNTASRLTLNFGVSDKGMMVYDTTISNVMYWTGTVWLPLGGGLVPVGASLNTQVIYNNAGVLEGDTGLTFNNATDALTVSGIRISKGNISTDITNTAIGNGASNSIISSIFTTAVGRAANATCTGGNSGTAIGYNALNLNNVGNGNTAVGTESLYNAVGDGNTAIGYLAGQLKTTGSNCGFFGSNSQASAVGASDEYTYGDTNVTNHRFANGNISALNGNLNSSGASAALRITSSTGDMYQTVASKLTPGAITSITVVFTVSNYLGNTVLVDAQLVGFQSFADFCLGKYATQATQVLRTNASAGITSTLTEAAGIHTLTITIGAPSVLELSVLNLKVSVGGGFTVAPTFTVLPVVTFI